MDQIVSGHRNRKYPPRVASIRAKASNYKAHAKMDGRDWNLSFEEASDLLVGCCYYCGDPPSHPFNSMKNRSRIGKDRLLNKALVESGSVLINGIDRKDNRLGYSPSNCVPCCTRCNSAKMTRSHESFESWLDRVAVFRSTKCRG